MASVCSMSGAPGWIRLRLPLPRPLLPRGVGGGGARRRLARRPAGALHPGATRFEVGNHKFRGARRAGSVAGSTRLDRRGGGGAPRDGGRSRAARRDRGAGPADLALPPGHQPGHVVAVGEALFGAGHDSTEVALAAIAQHLSARTPGGAFRPPRGAAAVDACACCPRVVERALGHVQAGIEAACVEGKARRRSRHAPHPSPPPGSFRPDRRRDCGIGAGAGFPTRPVTINVPFAPVGRATSSDGSSPAALAAQLGQPVIVENAAGAGGTIGTQSASPAPHPSGYTLTLGHSGTLLAAKPCRSIPISATTRAATSRRSASWCATRWCWRAQPAQRRAGSARFHRLRPHEEWRRHLRDGWLRLADHLASALLLHLADLRGTIVAYRGPARPFRTSSRARSMPWWSRR